jgi:D-alanyl-D-alanine carboxypeptidase
MDAKLAALINARPGSSQAEILARYGRFRYSESSSTRGQIVIDQNWSNANLVKLTEKHLPGFPFKVPYNRDGMWVHTLVAEPTMIAWAETRRQNLARFLATWDGTWVARHQLWNPANPLSIHSWAIGHDFNAAAMRYGLPLSRVPQQFLEFYELWEECGWTWGGRWTPGDAMHLQWTDPIPGTPRGMTPLRGTVSGDPPKPPMNPADPFEGKRLIVNGDYLGRVAKASAVGDKLYINSRDD